MTGVLRRGLIAGVVGAVVAALAAAPAGASQDPNPPWPQLLPPLPVTKHNQPHPMAHCRRATMRCIDGNIRRLRLTQNRFGCDHRAVFATTYLELTKVMRSAMRQNPHLFADRRYMFYEDTLFVNYYFRMLRSVDQGRPIPEAWRIAIDAAASGDDNAGQDMLLGINAHVQRDMPYVVAQLGLVRRNGASRKPDHDRFNDVLNSAYEPVVEAIRNRYDGIIALTNASWDPLDDIGGMEMVKGWREGVWRNAERLVNARTASQRAQVEQSIETNAATWARMIATPQVPGYRAQRDAYCHSKLGR